MSTENDGASRAVQIAVVVVAAVLIGTALGAALLGTGIGGTQEETKAVAVVSIEGPITAQSADAIREELRSVRQNESIEAVVLRINSPGGAVAASESLYLAVKRTAEQMPVVASVGNVGASGAYYALLPSERVYVTPGSIVGSVGVIAYQPGSGGVGSQIVTGPDKGGGGTEAEVIARVETLHRTFLNTVVEERGDEIVLNRSEIANAKVYAGAKAVENGFADEIGGVDAAIADAARRAGLDEYTVVHREPEGVGGLILLQAGNGTVRVREQTFGYSGVDTTVYLALWGVPDDSPEVVADE